MKKINPFDRLSFLYPYRWFMLLAVGMTIIMAYHDLTGRRIFKTGNQQQWVNSGPGFHK